MPATGEESHATDAKEKFHSAIEWFRKALSQDLGDNRVARQATYLIGLCLMEQGDLPAALNQMERTARLFPETPECLAALYQQGDIARRMGRHTEAVLAYRRLVSAYARQDEFHNPWINLPQIEGHAPGRLPGLLEGREISKRPCCSASRSCISCPRPRPCS